MKKIHPVLMACIAGMTGLMLARAGFGQAIDPKEAPDACGLPNPPAVSAQPAATQPSEASAQHIKDLIVQLGAESFAKRDAASKELTKIGKPALAALKEATNSADPEVVARAKDAMTDIAAKDVKPMLANGNPTTIQMQGVMQMNQIRVINGAGGGNGMMTFSVVNQGGTSDSTVIKNGTTFHLHTDATGIKMSVTDQGKTTDYAAKDADDLKKKDPKAYKIYEENFGNLQGGNAAIQFGPGAGIIMRQAAVHGMPPATEPTTQPGAANK